VTRVLSVFVFGSWYWDLGYNITVMGGINSMLK
jgi:hypothetical protein